MIPAIAIRAVGTRIVGSFFQISELFSRRYGREPRRTSGLRLKPGAAESRAPRRDLIRSA